MAVAYRWLAGVVGLTLAVFGSALFAGYFAYQVPGSLAPFPGGPLVHYAAATAGCAMFAWGAGLAGGALRNDPSRSLGTATGWAFAGLAAMRIVAWFSGDYYALAGDLPRAEAAVFLLLALAFVWLRPKRERRIWS